MRLTHSDPSTDGYRRRRSGRGFTYRDTHDRPLPAAERQRIESLVIPPAWKDVWICPSPTGHIQATGTDDAGRRQYLYHPQWRERRDARKFRHVLDTAARLPRLRRQVTSDLRGRGLTRTRVLAGVARLLDIGLFRVGSDEYANGDNPTFGIATLLVRHVRVHGSTLTFTFRAKGGLAQEILVDDPGVARLVASLARERRPRQRLFAYRAPEGSWRIVHGGDINDYLRESLGDEMTAKDFRTWHGTVLAAKLLASAGPQSSPSAQKKAIAGVMRDVASALGNTPAVARSSYVDPTVVEYFRQGRVVESATESAVVRLLST